MSRKRTIAKAAKPAPRTRRALSGRVAAYDPDNPPATAAELAQMKPVALSKRIRWNLSMSQEAFSQAYRIPLGTIRDWEQYRTEPDAAARTLLQLIEADPKGVLKRLEKVPA